MAVTETSPLPATPDVLLGRETPLPNDAPAGIQGCSRRRMLEFLLVGGAAIGTAGIVRAVIDRNSRDAQGNQIATSCTRAEKFFRAVWNVSAPEHHEATFLDVADHCIAVAQECATKKQYPDSRFFWFQAEEVLQEHQKQSGAGTTEAVGERLAQCQSALQELRSCEGPLRETDLAKQYGLAVAALRRRMSEPPNSNPTLAQDTSR